MKLYIIKSIVPIDCAKIEQEFKKALKDKTIDIIDISINSPGGGNVLTFGTRYLLKKKLIRIKDCGVCM